MDFYSISARNGKIAMPAGLFANI